MQYAVYSKGSDEPVFVGDFEGAKQHMAPGMRLVRSNLCAQVEDVQSAPLVDKLYRLALLRMTNSSKKLYVAVPRDQQDVVHVWSTWADAEQYVNGRNAIHHSFAVSGDLRDACVRAAAWITAAAIQATAEDVEHPVSLPSSSDDTDDSPPWIE